VPIRIPSSVWPLFAESPAEFVAKAELTEISTGELSAMARGGLRQVTLPATIMLGQKLRRGGVPAHEWTLGEGGAEVLLSVRHSNFMPYFWELGRRNRGKRVEAVMSRLAPTHDFYSGCISAPDGKIDVADIKPAAKKLRVRIGQLQKSEVLRRSNALIVAVKIDLVIDLTQSNLPTYLHAHFVIAVPRVLTVPQLAQLGADAAARVGGHRFGQLLPIHSNTVGYFLKHPIKLNWGSGTGYLTNVDAAAKLTPKQAVQIFRATARLSFFTITRTVSSVLSPSIRRLTKATVEKQVSLFLPVDEASEFVLKQAERIEIQRRTFERLACRISEYPLGREDHRRSFRNVCQRFWTEYRVLRDIGPPVCAVYLNGLGPRPVHRRPEGVPKPIWDSDLQRIRRMRTAIHVVEIVV
jgi:hypothetical protein